MKDYEEINIYNEYIKEASAFKLLTIEEEHELGRRIKEENDMEARNKLCEHNLLLVVKIAKSFEGKGLDILDLIQEGNLGLLHAIDKYDYTRSTKFSTYATWWIKKYIATAVAEKSTIIKIPVNAQEKLKKLKVAEARLTHSLGRMPSQEEVCEYLDIDENEYKNLKRLSLDVLSLDAPMSENEDTLADYIASTLEPPTNTPIPLELSKKEIQDLLGSLSDRERKIVILRQGWNGEKKRTLDEIGEMFNISRERARQIEIEAFDKLHNLVIKKYL